jgi:dihydrofolate reductase
VDIVLFGRVTYEGMVAYWTTPDAMRDAPVISAQMNQIPKIVFSRTLASADWHNTRLIKDNIVEEIFHLKQQPGKDLIIFGSANLTASFIGLGLIDEFRLIVNPVVLGTGVPFFRGIEHKLNLKLAQTRTFRSGNVLLYYQPGK